MAYYLGIDGGGTKTRCVLADETTVLATSMSGGSNIVRLGETHARDALHTSIRQVCSNAKIAPDRIHAVCIGAAGAARPEIAAKLRNILAEVIPSSCVNIEVIGDVEIAHEAAFGGGPGIIAVAGTGSIVYGRNASGDTARAGGWGFAISDEGSGHWIGRRAVSAVLRARDQNLSTALTAMILQAWKLSTLDELVQQANATLAPEFPRLFPVILRAADDGDPVARELLCDAGAQLATLATIVLRRLSNHVPELLPVAVTGSVFRQSSVVREVFYNTLQTNFPGIEVRLDPVDPVHGALSRARRSSGAGVT